MSERPQPLQKQREEIHSFSAGGSAACASPYSTTPIGMAALWETIQFVAAQIINAFSGFWPLSTIIHNNSDRPILLMPVHCTDDAPPSLGIVREGLVRNIPVGESIEVGGHNYDLNEMNISSQIRIFFRAGNVGETVEEFETRVRNEGYFNGFDVDRANPTLHNQLTPNLYLNCNVAGQVQVVMAGAGHAAVGQVQPASAEGRDIEVAALEQPEERINALVGLENV